MCSRTKGSSASSSLETALKDLRELMKMESKLTKPSEHRAENQILKEKTLEKSK